LCGFFVAPPGGAPTPPPRRVSIQYDDERAMK
jgi:hypothetical protein